jgi:hypothetical protein
MAKPDLTYSAPDGIWTRFYPETDAGEDAWHVMADAMPDGVVAFLPAQVPGVLAQLRAAGLTVRKARPHKPMTADELDGLLAELDALT